jgi:hypothetical protein
MCMNIPCSKIPIKIPVALSTCHTPTSTTCSSVWTYDMDVNSSLVNIKIPFGIPTEFLNNPHRPLPTQAIHGISTGYFLRWFGGVTHEAVRVIVTVLIACIQWFLWENAGNAAGGSSNDMAIKVQVLLLVVVGSLLYNTAPAK